MSEPWKAIYCDSDTCLEELNQDTVEELKIYPDVDNETVTQFTCPRCGKVETWGVTRRDVARILHERFKSW